MGRLQDQPRGPVVLPGWAAVPQPRCEELGSRGGSVLGAPTQPPGQETPRTPRQLGRGPSTAAIRRGGSSRAHRAGSGARQHPKGIKGKSMLPPPSIQGAHPCRSPMGAGQWLQTPPQELLRASWRWEMAPCHHGNGATGLPCRGDGHMQSPVERSTGASRAPSTGHQPRAPSCHLPSTLWPRHRAHLLLLHHQPHQDATPAGCHPSRMPPRQDATQAGRPPGTTLLQLGSPAPLQPGAQRWARGAGAGCSPSSRTMMRIVKVII